MEFCYSNIITSPLFLLFVASALGAAIGKINWGRFNLGASSALFTGLIFGYYAYRYGESILALGEGADGYASADALINNGSVLAIFFDLFLIMFMASVSLLASKDLGMVLKKYGIKFITLAVVVTLTGAVCTYALTFVGKSDVFSVAGVYTGALTSSPGLAVAIETAGSQAGKFADKYESQSDEYKEAVLSVIDSSRRMTAKTTPVLSSKDRKLLVRNAEANVAIGHVIGYPFGVIVVIFAMNFFPLIFRINVQEEKRKYVLEMKVDADSNNGSDDQTPFNLIPYCIVCVLGYLLGEIGIPMGFLGNFSLGATGGVLIVGLILGYIGKIGPLSFRMETKALSLVREIAIVFFLATVGLRFGYKTFNALAESGLYLAMISLVIGMAAMLVGFLLGRYIFKLNWIILSGAICGGMTSTPGLGSAIDSLKSDEPALGYGATYPFALLCMVIFTVLLHNLPIV